MYNLNRFIIAQDKVYTKVINELKKGKKKTHWMWYIFPQLKELGYSDKALFYGIENIDEAKEYVSNYILHQRYIECCRILLNLNIFNIIDVLGDIDSLKLKSSLTLFMYADESNKELYQNLIKKFYDGRICKTTYDILNN